MQTITHKRKKINVSEPERRAVAVIAANGGVTMVSDLAEGRGKRTRYACPQIPPIGCSLAYCEAVKARPNDYPPAVRKFAAKHPRVRNIVYLTPRVGKAIARKLGIAV